MAPHFTSSTSSIFFQHGTHGYTHSTTRDIDYIYSLSTSINYGITSPLPTFVTPAAPTCHKTHSQPTATPTFNKTPPHPPQSRHSSTTSHTQNSRFHSCTTPIKSTKSKESLTKLRRLHQPSLTNSGAVQTIAALHGTAGNPQSSHRTNSYSGTRTITTESPIGTIPAPWSSQEDETLISLKSDSKARPRWASVGARMRRTPSECKARWQLLRLQQTAPSETMPPPPPPTSTNPGPPRPPTPHS